MTGYVCVLAKTACQSRSSRNVISCDLYSTEEDQLGMENVEFCTLAATVSETLQATHYRLLQNTNRKDKIKIII